MGGGNATSEEDRGVTYSASGLIEHRQAVSNGTSVNSVVAGAVAVVIVAAVAVGVGVVLRSLSSSYTRALLRRDQQRPAADRSSAGRDV